MADETFLPQNAALVDQRGFITRPWWPVFQKLKELIAAVIPIDLATETTGVLPAAKIGPHRTSHEPGGSDALQLTGASRLFGRGSTAGAGPLQEIVLGTNLSMAGTTLHAAGGGGGTGDVTGPASAGDSNVALFNGTSGKVLKDGGIAAAQLALKDAPNIFTQGQTITTNPPAIILHNIGLATDQRRFQTYVDTGSGNYVVAAVTDAGSFQIAPISAQRSGDVTIGRNLSATNLSATNLSATNVSATNNVTASTVSGSSDVSTPGYMQADGWVQSPVLVQIDSAQPANQRRFDVKPTIGYWVVQVSNDGGGALLNGFAIDRAGNGYTYGRMFERGRSYGVGEWIDVPFNAANFAVNVGTISVNAPSINKYTLIGNTMLWTCWTNMSITSGTPTLLLFTIPGGLTLNTVASTVAYGYINNVWTPCRSEKDGTRLAWGSMVGGGTFAGNVYLYFTAILQIA